MILDIAQIPSPFEIEQNKTPNGGWTRSVLASWGVPWPPPRGWKEQLEKAYEAGQTIGCILECIGCREAKYFVDEDPHPVCVECREWEQKRYEEQHAEIRPVQQIRPYKKQPIPPDIRWAVWERDNFTCRHCGSRKNLSVDHIIPESKGGELTMENTQTLCKPCNSRKGAR